MSQYQCKIQWNKFVLSSVVLCIYSNLFALFEINSQLKVQSDYFIKITTNSYYKWVCNVMTVMTVTSVRLNLVVEM